MKKITKILTVLALVLTGSLYTTQALAGLCFITTPSDSAGEPNSLRNRIEKKYNLLGANSNCNPIGSADGDKKYFQQVMLFVTPEVAAENAPEKIEKIIMGDKDHKNKTLTFNNSSKDVVIGNLSLAAINDTGIDVTYSQAYKNLVIKGDNESNLITGMVTIDAQKYFDKGKAPFVCSAGTKPVYFRNITLLTNNVTKADLPDCIKDAGNFIVHPGDTEIMCNDKKDNDEDGKMDCSDSDCKDDAACNNGGGGSGNKEVCDNFDDKGIAIDDNGDGFANCLDTTCECEPIAEDCFKDGDEDGNKLADCDDAYCASLNLSKCEDDSEYELDELACGDGKDNDKDGKIDCGGVVIDGKEFDADAECAEWCQGTKEICDDLDPLTNAGIDNNNDGDANCADATCKNDPKCSHALETECNDHLDNDRDTLIDCDDIANCANESNCIPPPPAETGCADNVDDDADGVIDCDDSDCAGDIACAAENVDDDNDGFAESAGDCNDNDSTAFPGNKETCGDSKDNNCDANSTGIPLIDEGCAGDPAEDDDGDGFCENPEACASTDIKPGDCDDTNKDINPEAVEICDDNINNDCDSATSDAGDTVDPATDGTVNPLIKKVLDGGGLSCSTSQPPPESGSGASSGGCGCDISQKSGASMNMSLVILAFMLSMIPVGLRLRKKS